MGVEMLLVASIGLNSKLKCCDRKLFSYEKPGMSDLSPVLGMNDILRVGSKIINNQFI